MRPYSYFVGILVEDILLNKKETIGTCITSRLINKKKCKEGNASRVGMSMYVPPTPFDATPATIKIQSL